MANFIANDVRRAQSSNDIDVLAGGQTYTRQASGQFNENKIYDGADALFDPVKQDGFTPSALRAGKRRKKKGFSQSL
jgi:hypothetical protein